MAELAKAIHAIKKDWLSTAQYVAVDTKLCFNLVYGRLFLIDALVVL